MLLDGSLMNGFGLGIALADKTRIEDAEMNEGEFKERLEEEKREEMQKEVNIMVNQIGKIDQPMG